MHKILKHTCPVRLHCYLEPIAFHEMIFPIEVGYRASNEYNSLSQTFQPVAQIR